MIEMQIIMEVFFNYLPMICILFMALILIAIAIRFIVISYKKPIKENAKVIDKYQSHGTRYDFETRKGFKTVFYNTVCFDVNGKVKKFNVSPLAYDYLQKGMQGELKYIDNKYIDFDEKGEYYEQ